MKTYADKSMEKCEICGRKFAEGRLAIHQKSCTVEHPAKGVVEKQEIEKEFISDKKGNLGIPTKKNMQRTSCEFQKMKWP